MLHRSRDPFSTRRPHRELPRSVALLTSFLVLCLLFPNPVLAHSALKAASPGDSDNLSAAPRELRLSFNEVVELAVSRLGLTGPQGAVALAPIAVHPDSASVLIAGIKGPLVAGSYTVNWQVVGADGHPVRGEYAFTVAEDARGLATGQTATTEPTGPAAPTASAAVAITGSSGSSTLLWIIGAVVLGIVGVVMFQLLMHRPEADDAGEHA